MIKERESIDLINFLTPIKEFEVDTSLEKNIKCYNCGNEDSRHFEKLKAKAWTDKYMCYNCGCMNYIIFTDRMGGNWLDTVKVFKLHPKSK